MSTIDYIPNTNSEFNDWQGNFISNVELNKTEWAIPVDALAAIKAKQTAYKDAYKTASNYRDRSQAEVQEKNGAWEEYEEEIRSFVKEYLLFNRKISNSSKTKLGLTIPSEERNPSPVPVEVPTGRINFSVRLQHSIHIISSSTGKKAKPKGVHGCEIWIKVGGEAPKTDADFDFEAVNTRPPYKVEFKEDDLGKTVYYHLRYVNTRGETGPWSNIFSAVIGG